MRRVYSTEQIAGLAPVFASNPAPDGDFFLYCLANERKNGTDYCRLQLAPWDLTTIWYENSYKIWFDLAAPGAGLDFLRVNDSDTTLLTVEGDFFDRDWHRFVFFVNAGAWRHISIEIGFRLPDAMAAIWGIGVQPTPQTLTCDFGEDQYCGNIHALLLLAKYKRIYGIVWQVGPLPDRSSGNCIAAPVAAAVPTMSTGRVICLPKRTVASAGETRPFSSRRRSRSLSPLD